MKVVINKCFGGFGLSHEAMMKIFELKGITVFPYSCKSQYKSDGESIHTYKRITGEFNPTSIMESVSYFLTDPQVDSYVVTSDEYFCSSEKYGETEFDFRFDDKNRNDPDLVKAVEILGGAANGNYSKLEVVEILDDYAYQIHEYDGLETLYYGLNLKSV